MIIPLDGKGNKIRHLILERLVPDLVLFCDGFLRSGCTLPSNFAQSHAALCGQEVRRDLARPSHAM